MNTAPRSMAAAFVATLIAFVALDAVWLSQVGFGMFKSRLGDILRPTPMVGAVILFYVVYACGIVGLAVRPALQANSWRLAAAHGAMLGLTAYATFDLTCLAVIERWTIGLAVTDMAWGTVASLLAAIAGFAAARRASSQHPTAA